MSESKHTPEVNLLVALIKRVFPKGMTYIEYSERDRVRIYKEGSILSSWQIDLPATGLNTARLRVISDTINCIPDLLSDRDRLAAENAELKELLRLAALSDNDLLLREAWSRYNLNLAITEVVAGRRSLIDILSPQPTAATESEEE